MFRLMYITVNRQTFTENKLPCALRFVYDRIYVLVLDLYRHVIDNT
jgi:hypothetical protein